MTDFEGYATARAPALRRTAYLLCGDWSRAEDLTQDALVKLYVGWRRASRADNLDGYARRTLVNCWIDANRRAGRREHPVDVVPEPPAGPGADSGLAVRDALIDALRRMPDGQRACVVLRFWEDLSIAQTAALLDVTESTVKSQTTRGLRALRGFAADLAPTAEGHPE